MNDPATEPQSLELTQEQGDRLAWILDFVCDPRNRAFNETSWPDRMLPLLDQLHAKGYHESHQ